MAEPTPAGGRSFVSAALAEDRLGIPSVIFFVVSAAAPLTVVIGLVPTGYAVAGAKSLPFAFLAVAATLALFCVGYVAMARHISNAGAFYAYATRGLGRPVGVATALVALLTYNALMIPLYGGFGYFVSGWLNSKYDLNLSWWATALVVWLIVGVLGVLRVDLNSKILAVLLVAEVTVLLILDAADIGNPAGGSISFDSLAPANIAGVGFGAAVVIAITGFAGFESAAVYGEETRDRRRTVTVSTFAGLVIIGLLYAGSAWAMSVATGSDQIVAKAGESLAPDAAPLVLALAADNISPTFSDIAFILFGTSMLAASISFHNTVARYTFALGRERVLPVALGRTATRTGAPVVASVVQSILGFVVLVLFAAMGWDPLVQLFYYGGTLGGFGLLLLVLITSFAVIGFFAKDSRGESAWTRLVAPILAIIAVGFVIFRAVENFYILLNVADSDPLRWILPASYVVVAAVGILLALALRTAKPDVYATIGLGADSVAAQPAAPLNIPSQVERTGAGRGV
jgi:amino acid transporter